MAQLNLLNNSKKTVEAGSLVTIDPHSKNSFLEARLGIDIIIGTAAQRIKRNSWGLINLVNTVSWNDVLTKPNIEPPELEITPELIATIVENLPQSNQPESGLSAYEIAVNNGFTGTEQEWLASLHGEDGSDGDDGYIPIKGVDYFDGTNGEDGDDGAPGTPGSDANVTKQNVEAVLTGPITSHSHSYEPENSNIQSHVISAHAPSDAVSLSTVKADTDIASAINLKHSNSLDHAAHSDDQDLSGKVDKITSSSLVADTEIAKIHSNTLDHSHNNKATLDSVQEALTTALKTSYDGAVTHAGSGHAPSNAQKNSDITQPEIEAKLTGTISSHSHAGGGSPPAWKGSIISCWKDGDPMWILDSMLHNPIHATPTNIAITVARCAFFKLDTNITVNKIRWFGVGATTGVYRVALYRLSDLARLQILNDFNTAAQTWGNGAFSVTLTAGVIYFIAVAVDAVGTTAGVACHSGTTGRIGILPTAWPGGLQINAGTPKIDAMGFAQFAVTTGALPNPAATLALQAAWTGGFPAFFLDSNNA